MDKFDLILSVMTPLQQKRWRMYLAGAKLVEIARYENVSYQAVQDSLTRGRKRAQRTLG